MPDDMSPLPAIVQRRGYNIRDTSAASFVDGLVMILLRLCMEVQIGSTVASFSKQITVSVHPLLCPSPVFEAVPPVSMSDLKKADIDALYNIYIHIGCLIQLKKPKISWGGEAVSCHCGLHCSRHRLGSFLPGCRQQRLWFTWDPETSGECQKRAEPEPGMHLWFEDRKVMRLAGIKTGSGT